MRYLRFALLGLLGLRQEPVALLSLILGSAAIVSVLVIAALFPGAAQGNPGADEPPMPVPTVVTPVVKGVNPVEKVVTPITGMAEAETSAVEPGAADEGSSSSVFSGLRGGFIGAGIALGLVVVATVVIRGARRAFRRVR